jgi:DNA recombination protein RmuC
MQYAFKDGTIVDAVIFIKDHLIPIDSKFSLENYNRILESKSQLEKEKFEALFYDDLKTRINETAKYIKPEEGTYEFAFMFIPSEAVYYDLLINKVGAVKSNTRDLINYATGEKKVMIVSPTTFLAYLQTVLQGLKAMQIEESAKEIKKNVETLGKHLASYGEYLLKIGTNLGTTVNIYNQASKEFHKIDKDIYRITGVSENIEIPLIEKPET